MTYPTNPQAPGNQHRVRNGILTGLTLLILVFCGGVGVAAIVNQSTDSGSATTPMVTAGPGIVLGSEAAGAARSHPAVTSKPATTAIGDGTWQTGDEVPPGTYTTTADSDGFGCYWARLRNFDGELSSIITNGNIAPGGRGRLTIKRGDKGVELSGGCSWTRR